MALDDRALAASRGGWSKVAVRTAYARTLSTSTRAGAYLAKAGVYGTGLTLVVNKAPGAGTLGVYVKGRLVTTVKLTARRAATKQLVAIRTGRMTNATIVVKVLAAGRGVAVDGLAIAP